MRNYETETKNRVAFLADMLKESGASGFVFGNSGGKDSALVGALLRRACDRVLGVILPCHSGRNYGEDRDDALRVAETFGIETLEVDLTAARASLLADMERSGVLPTDAAKANIAPRLRMTTLYAIAQSRNLLVAGTGNRSERYVGYFTKWGDGAFDVNPIADLSVSEIYPFLEYLGAPANVIEKPPSAGLFDGQTDEAEMGIKYRDLDAHLRGEAIDPAVRDKIEQMHRRTEHKRRPAKIYGE